MTNQDANARAFDLEWRGLYKIGGIAALIAGILFRRNLAAEIGLLSNQISPVEVSDWFALL